MQAIGYIAVSFFAVPLIIILAVSFMPRRLSDRIGLTLAGAAAIIQASAAAAGLILLAVSRSGEYDFTLLWQITAADSARFALKPLSLVILFCVGFVSFISVLIALHTVEKKRSSFTTLLMTLTLGMNGMLIVTDLFSLYVFLEVVGVSCFVLIAMFKSETGLEGAFKYLVMSALASIFILSGLAFLFTESSSLSYAAVGMNLLSGKSGPLSLIYAAFILLIAGFAIKAGAVPFHSWLPDAHQSANTAVSVLLSGIVIKVAGIYGLMVLTGLFGSVPAIKLTLAVMGIVSIIVGALLGLRQDHFKRIVACSSVSQMGYILLAISTGSTLGLVGALFHIFNHATVKCTLFANAAALHEQTGTLDINEMGGLQNRMPVTGFSSITAFLSMTGMPPFAGFWSKFLIILALWNGNMRTFAVIALLASILTASYFLRMLTKVYFGRLPERFAELREVGGSIKFAEIMLTTVMIVVGVVFPLILIYLNKMGML